MSLASLFIVFLAGMDQTEDTKGCQVAAAILHYLMLSTFMWTAVNAHNLYQVIVVVFSDRSETRYFRVASLVAWGKC